ncbi:hypothetical protein NLJ89_g8634 [Agrocybe chaxingu]|uniref:Uncharacterized protein n=1 Tax=Agrocybe chaxingu TaxID=84603 RepID=A0A9W8MRZ6_9AGAR|nr:hypothetical protein NLJ89_g8634 [Agrocybe chaxingu]
MSSTATAAAGQVNENFLAPIQRVLTYHQPVSSEPPSIFIFNVGRSSPRQINDGPVDDTTLLQSFINALQSIKANGYVVQGAMYGPEGANIFIDTDDEDWDAQISIQ